MSNWAAFRCTCRLPYPYGCSFVRGGVLWRKWTAPVYCCVCTAEAMRRPFSPLSTQFRSRSRGASRYAVRPRSRRHQPRGSRRKGRGEEDSLGSRTPRSRATSTCAGTQMPSSTRACSIVKCEPLSTRARKNPAASLEVHRPACRRRHLGPRAENRTPSGLPGQVRCSPPLLCAIARPAAPAFRASAYRSPLSLAHPHPDAGSPHEPYRCNGVVPASGAGSPRWTTLQSAGRAARWKDFEQTARMTPPAG